MDAQDFDRLILEMKQHGMSFPNEIPRLKLEGAEKIAIEMFSKFIPDAEWLPHYKPVADWLRDNEHKGLLLYGSNGTGKTTLIRTIIPAIFLSCHRKVVKYYDMYSLRDNFDTAMGAKFLALDDIGRETEINTFGQRTEPIPELVDKADRNGTLLLLATNLRGEELKARYGERTFDRIIGLTTRVPIVAQSFREKKTSKKNINPKSNKK